MTNENLNLLKEIHMEIWQIREKVEDDEAKLKLLEVMDKLYTIIEDYY